MKYEEFLRKFTEKVNIPNEVFNPIIFKEQFLQSIYIFEEYLSLLYKNKIILMDLFSGSGIYSLFFGLFYGHKIKDIYATEKDSLALFTLKKTIKKFKLYEIIHPLEVSQTAGYSPFILADTATIRKADAFIANPPYVPVPFGTTIPKWADGGCLGISAIIEMMKGLKRYSKRRSLFGCLGYSIGHKKIEMGSIILGNLKIPIANLTLQREYDSYKEILLRVFRNWRITFFVLYPAAWVGYSKKQSYQSIDLLDYYRLFLRKDEKLRMFYEYFPYGYRSLNNVFIVGCKNKNARYKKDRNPIIIIKNIGEDYIDEVMEVESKCWPKYLQASKSNIMSRLKYFYDGCVGAFNIKGRLIGFATSQIINFKPHKCLDFISLEKWMKLDYYRKSSIVKTSDPKGNALHLVSACVLPEYRRMGIWQDMIIQRMKVAKLLGLKYSVIITRLIINKKINEQNIMNYVRDLKDPYLRFLNRFGFMSNGILRKPEDLESGGYWVLMYRDL